MLRTSVVRLCEHLWYPHLRAKARVDMGHPARVDMGTRLGGGATSNKPSRKILSKPLRSNVSQPLSDLVKQAVAGLVQEPRVRRQFLSGSDPLSRFCCRRWLQLLRVCS